MTENEFMSDCRLLMIDSDVHNKRNNFVTFKLSYINIMNVINTVPFYFLNRKIIFYYNDKSHNKSNISYNKRCCQFKDQVSANTVTLSIILLSSSRWTFLVLRFKVKLLMNVYREKSEIFSTRLPIELR